MTGEMLTLLAMVASVAFLHALLGPDHFLPFIALSRSRGWSMTKTAAITAGCGVGHAAGSILLGLIGVAAGAALSGLQVIEGLRGELAAWILVAFGIVYGVWGLRRAARGARHSHLHIHADGTRHDHGHNHEQGHLHVHDAPAANGGEKRQGVASVAPWTIFIIFLLGPCEPLIPLMMLPAVSADWVGLALVTGIFTLVTVVTMVSVVSVLVWGVKAMPTRGLERYGHALAGGTMALGGLTVVGLGL